MASFMTSYHGEVQGFWAEPTEGQGPWPGVVLIHEWWGLNEQVKTQAEALAEQGYQVLAVDLYGSVAGDESTAERLMHAVDHAEALANMRAAMAKLKAHPQGTGKVGCLGWCMGGAYSLALAKAERSGLAACAIYYGVRLEDDPTMLRGIAPVVGAFGAEDPMVPVASVRAFEQALEDAHVPHAVTVYEGAGHAFANPTRSERYRPQQANEAWAATLAWFRKHLA